MRKNIFCRIRFSKDCSCKNTIKILHVLLQKYGELHDIIIWTNKILICVAVDAKVDLQTQRANTRFKR